MEIQAFAGVKADYDRVETFFEFSSRFFVRLSILEDRAPSSGPLALAIVRVFSSQLSICGHIEFMIKEKRWSKIPYRQPGVRFSKCLLNG